MVTWSCCCGPGMRHHTTMECGGDHFMAESDPGSREAGNRKQARDRGKVSFQETLLVSYFPNLHPNLYFFLSIILLIHHIIKELAHWLGQSLQEPITSNNLSKSHQTFPPESLEKAFTSRLLQKKHSFTFPRLLSCRQGFWASSWKLWFRHTEVLIFKDKTPNRVPFVWLVLKFGVNQLGYSVCCLAVDHTRHLLSPEMRLRIGTALFPENRSE